MVSSLCFQIQLVPLQPGNRLSAAAALNHPWMKHVTNVRPAPLRIKSKLRDFAKGGAVQVEFSLPIR
jgi:calcium/calmodulin-dependent protein kinase I